MSENKRRPNRKDEAVSPSAQKTVALASIVAAVIGGLSGYVGSHLHTEALRSMKKDDIARSLTEMDLERMAKLGVQSDYSPISYYAVHRRILEGFDASKEASLEQVRDNMEKAMQVCSANRELLVRLLIEQSDHGRLHELAQSMRDDIDRRYSQAISSIPDTPGGEQRRNMLRQLAIGERRRIDILETMSVDRGQNGARQISGDGDKETSEDVE